MLFSSDDDFVGAVDRACTYDEWETAHSTDFRKIAGISSRKWVLSFKIQKWTLFRAFKV
jgi:hypothetical protein